MTVNSERFPTQVAIPKEEKAHDSTLNRREFLTYAWGVALALVSVQSAATGFLFMRPRFRPGEFGGEFALGSASALPAIDAPPQPMSDGKFWLVNTAQGPKALYMVCTHLGCLYKWSDSLGRFRCPCHNSEFSREGELLHGPASRALDQFVVKVVVDDQIVSESHEEGDRIIPPQLGNAQARIVVNTGKKIVGR